MKKTILITGSTDGIGLETAKLLAKDRHRLILHGRNSEKLATAENAVRSVNAGVKLCGHIADFSVISAVKKFAEEIATNYPDLDVLINNAGIFRTQNSVTTDGLDIRFVVNTIAPWILTQQLIQILGESGRVVNLTSAAQAPVDLEALEGKRQLSAMDAYSQSKLALIQWSHYLAKKIGNQGPAIISVNPGSLLATKMVKEGFGVEGKSTSIGAQVLVKAALSDAFANASGRYFDNDIGRFSEPHPAASDEQAIAETVRIIHSIV